MPFSHDPRSMPWRELAWVVAMAMLGGISSFANRVRNGQLEHHWAAEIIADSLYALAAGFMIYFMCISWGGTEYDAAALAILAGHFGARTLQFAQRAIIKRYTDITIKTYDHSDDDQ